MKRVVILTVSLLAILIFAFSLQSTPNHTSNSAAQKTGDFIEVTPPAQKQESICNGTTVTRDCVADGINYSTYIYHPAVAEKSHTETVTTYEDEISGYCTLCNDGTFSPSCATGRGACSHHDGVAQRNAPRYTSVPKTSSTQVIDSPAQEAFFEKVEK